MLYKIRMKIAVIVDIESNDDTAFYKLEQVKKELSFFRLTTPGCKVQDAFTDAMLKEEKFEV